MSGAMHTPGPWRVGPVDDTCVSYVSSDGKRREVAVMCGDYDNDDEWPVMEANARLCAAAPELAEALRWALAELNGKTRYDNDQQREECFALAEAALAKAAAGLSAPLLPRGDAMREMLERVVTALPVLETLLAVAGLGKGLAVARVLRAEIHAALLERLQ